ncbi:hypothetical protein HK096_004879 [Nowakowskiella sp. JEL0078]|nr:hypothetical protein HK096_004879 [Nowakowskiella sp. JEL0078]
MNKTLENHDILNSNDELKHFRDLGLPFVTHIFYSCLNHAEDEDFKSSPLIIYLLHLLEDTDLRLPFDSKSIRYISHLVLFKAASLSEDDYPAFSTLELPECTPEVLIWLDDHVSKYVQTEFQIYNTSIDEKLVKNDVVFEGDTLLLNKENVEENNPRIPTQALFNEKNKNLLSFNPSTTIINDTSHVIHVGLGHVGPIMYCNYLGPGEATTFKNAPWGGYRIVARHGSSPEYGEKDIAKPVSASFPSIRSELSFQYKILVTTGLTFAGTVAVVGAAWATAASLGAGAGASAAAGTAAVSVEAATVTTASTAAVVTSTSVAASTTTTTAAVTSTTAATAAGSTSAAVASTTAASTGTGTSVGAGTASSVLAGFVKTTSKAAITTVSGKAKEYAMNPLKAYDGINNVRMFYRDTAMPFIQEKALPAVIGASAVIGTTMAAKSTETKTEAKKAFRKFVKVFVDPNGIVHSDHWCNWGKHLVVSIEDDPENAEVYNIREISKS